MNIYQRLNEVRKAVQYLQKDATVTGYKAITHDLVTSEIRPHFIEQGIVVVPRQTHFELRDTDKATSKGVPFSVFIGTYDIDFVNIDEPTDKVTVTITATAEDTSDKNPGKAISYAVKYAFLKILSVETGESEESRHDQKPQLISDDQVTEINDFLKETGSDKAQFLTYVGGATSVEKITQAQYIKAQDGMRIKEMEILDYDQLSDEWFLARVGSIGGSSIASVVAGGTGATRKKLMFRLAGEILSGVKYEGYHNEHMDRGIQQESEARNMYSFITGNDVEQIGLYKYSEHKHFSPDGIVGKNGIIEIKCTIPSVHIETIISDKVPAAYRKQIQWGLHISGRTYCDFVSYSPLVSVKPIWIKRAERDEKLIKELDEGADKFIEEMLEIVKKIGG